MNIQKLDLYNNQYDYSILKSNIYAVSLVDILKTQKLTLEFCAKYILNKNFQFLEEEELITIEDVVKHQPHIHLVDLYQYLQIIKICKIDDDVEDFETYMNKYI
jgi:hypothetical protein